MDPGKSRSPQSFNGNQRLCYHFSMNSSISFAVTTVDFCAAFFGAMFNEGKCAGSRGRSSEKERSRDESHVTRRVQRLFRNGNLEFVGHCSVKIAVHQKHTPTMRSMSSLLTEKDSFGALAIENTTGKNISFSSTNTRH